MGTEKNKDWQKSNDLNLYQIIGLKQYQHAHPHKGPHTRTHNRYVLQLIISTLYTVYHSEPRYVQLYSKLIEQKRRFLGNAASF